MIPHINRQAIGTAWSGWSCIWN